MLEKKKLNVKDISLIALFAAVMAVCAWLTFPVSPVPVTLQTFGVFLTLLLLGGRNGTFSILIYILLGLAGAPVFSGFKGGPSALLGPTGGYITGFIFIGLIFLLCEKLISDSLTAKTVSLLIGLAVCYVFGTLWFTFVFNGEEKVTFYSALSMCVLPFIIPDLLKLIAAVLLSKALKPVLSKSVR